MKVELPMRIILLSPNKGVCFGLQKGNGSNYETILKQTATGDDLQFNFSISVQMPYDGSGGFSGPFAQGPKGAKFIYIDIGTYAGEQNSIWGRRLKIPLSGISIAMLEAVLQNDQMILETRVPGKGKDGTPNCATVKPFEGWQVVAR